MKTEEEGISSVQEMIERPAPLEKKDNADSVLRLLLERIAKENDHTGDFQWAADYLINNPWNEVWKARRDFFAALQPLLKEPIDLNEIKKVINNQGTTVLAGHGSTRAQIKEFLANKEFELFLRQYIINPGLKPDADRLNYFLYTEMQTGFRNKEGRPIFNKAALFISGILTAAYPDTFVDYRNDRWEWMRENFFLQDRPIKTYGDRLCWAGRIASDFAATPTFEKYFGIYFDKVHPNWIVAGVSYFLCKEPTMRRMVEEINGSYTPPKDEPEQGNEVEHMSEKARSPIQTTQNLIFYGPPGTGKTYQIEHELMPQFMDEKEKRYELVTFHQSYSYEEFVEGIRPVMGETKGNRDNIRYEIRPGIFKQIALRAAKQPDKAYAIFIDEINRGNISKIFGELITLIELDKRIKFDGNGLKIRLPYSQEEFGVPVNLSIIGAMNTADRSIAFIDTALRRRFAFVEVMPDAELVRKTIGGDLGSMVADLLIRINDRIEFLYDRDHRIGHSYFLNIKNYLDLKTVFLQHVIPLLQEYFYGDWEKICLVLGCPYSEDGTPYKEDAEPVINAFEMVKMDIIGFEHDVLENKLRYEICPEFINATESGVVRYFVDMIGK